MPKVRVLVAILLLGSAVAAAQAPPPAPALDLYRQLRSVGLDAKRIYRVRDLSLDREDLHITFTDGILAFTQAVDGRVTGAFFQGDGEVLLSPPDQAERGSMVLFTGAAILDEQFSGAYLRFTDDAFHELEPGLRPLLDEDPQEFAARWDAAARSLADVDALRLLVKMTAEPPPDAAPRRMLHLRMIGRHLGIFDINFDDDFADQISVGQVNGQDGKMYFDVWAAFPMRSARQAAQEAGAAASPRLETLRIRSYRIVAHVVPPSDLLAEAQVDAEVVRGGERTLIFELSRNLRVRSVTAAGEPLEVIQNEALEGSQLAWRGNDLVAVVFPRPLVVRQKLELHFSYGGPVMSDVGGGLMYVGARGIWYPNQGPAMAGFDLEFHYPKPWTLLATGKRLSFQEGESEQVAHWVSEKPIPIAGFNLGQYASSTVRAGDASVEAFAAPGKPEIVPSQSVAVVPPRWIPGTTEHEELAPVVLPPPDPLLKAKEVAAHSAQVVDFLAPRIGPFPYPSLALTEMPGPSSQGWPGLIFLSSFAYLNAEQRTHAGLAGYDGILYSRLMQGHETAHQWWGDEVLWKSYRDQWLVEALANYCSLLAMEGERPADFREVLEHYRQELLKKGPHGELSLAAGPVTLGTRLNSSHFPDGYDAVSYGRGTWLFHMLRALLRPPEAEAGGDPDAAFFGVLRGLRQRFAGRAMSTADVQRAFEEALPASVAYEGKRSLEWFFRGWVDGTAVPRIKLSEVRMAPRGASTVAAGKILQQEAPDSLVTSVPLYADTGGKQPVLLGRVFADGPETPFQFTLPPGTRKILLDPYRTLLTRP